LECESIEVNLDVAIPLGLITAEFITNAYKHAFAGRPGGTITISLARRPNGELCLTVADDGVGLPAGLDPEKAASLGLRLIQALSRQLRAKLSLMSSSGGSTMELAVPL
jgi:two-component sensor histidine kinase